MVNSMPVLFGKQAFAVFQLVGWKNKNDLIHFRAGPKSLDRIVQQRFAAQVHAKLVILAKAGTAARGKYYG